MKLDVAEIAGLEFFTPSFDPTITVAIVLTKDGNIGLSFSRPDDGCVYDESYGRLRALQTAAYRTGEGRCIK